MSDHFDYMPKPEGWVPPEKPTEEIDVTELYPDSDLSDGSDRSDKSDKSDKSDRSDSSASPEPDVPETQAEHFVSRCANWLSWILVPLMMPVYGIILIFSLSILKIAPFSTKLTFTLIVFGINLVVPMILVLLMKRLGMIQDVGLNGRKERLIPYIISIICLGGTGLFLYFKGAPLWVAMFYAGGALAALINLLVNFRWKISAHAAGIAGIVAMLIQIMKEGFPVSGLTWWIAGSILLAGLLGSARVWLGRHTLMQVLAGTAVGFLSVWTLSLIH